MISIQAQLDFLFEARHEPRSAVPLHRHGCHELVYYARGAGTTRIGDTGYRYAPGTYALIAPGIPHDERREDATEVVCVGFTLPDGTQAPLRTGLYAPAVASAIADTLSQLLEEMRGKKAFYESQLNLLTGQLLIAHLRHVGAPESELPDRRLAYARNYLHEHYNQKVSIEALADMAGYSYHHFRHLFRRQYERSPIQYLFEIRLEQARQLLKHTELSVSEIALRCGFSTDAQFCTMFKREMGERPLAYRRAPYGNTLFKPV
ncbi:helix-turn-helix transcriptional regulator [Cohnella nanjingensis]|uniref:Helix-turn-helix transcriptional regulator n=1 Tax=Cohnella nanjingensis TaxID=1387779 RepID=A0A7X0RW45_9BACL|nr:AraC family transcriptional regulator [Cohnella nanjingensis]MBB6674759.1 helix-turn-helix transcriptional regulator [Cohnella nanjingensis]